jgi:hypothetical protein
MFRILIGAAVLFPAGLLGPIWRDHKNKGWNWTTKDSRASYVKVLEIVAGVSGVAASLVSAVVSTGEPRSAGVLSSVRSCVVSLIICIIAALVAIFGLTRGYDRARGRFATDPRRRPGDDTEQGQLTDIELGSILVASYFCAVGFFLGFIFLANITFQIN